MLASCCYATGRPANRPLVASPARRQCPPTRERPKEIRGAGRARPRGPKIQQEVTERTEDRVRLRSLCCLLFKPPGVRSPPNVRAHRPPSPDLPKLPNSKAPVPRANGGSVRRSGSAIQRSSTQKSPLTRSLQERNDDRRCHCAGNVTAKHAKRNKRNPRPCVSSAVKNLYAPPSPPGSNLPASLRVCASALKPPPSKRKGAKTPR